MAHVIQFDVDGVLANFIGGYARLLGELGRPAMPAVFKWDDLNDRAAWTSITASPSFWMLLPPLVSADVFERINALQDQHEVYFVTARPGRYPKYQTEAWLASLGVETPTVVLSSRKAEFARAVGATHAIEDKAGNAICIAYQSPTTHSFIIDRCYNRFDHGVVGSKVERVASVAQFLDAIDEEGA